MIVFALAVLWILSLAVGRSAAPRWRRAGLIGVSIALFASIAVVSQLLNAGNIAALQEGAVATKRLALLLSYFAFFVLVLTIIRPGEVSAFAVLILGAACITALGTIYQYRAGGNPFYDFWNAVSGPFLDVDPAPLKENDYDRDLITGPAEHGLSVATMVTLALPIALAYLVESRTTRTRLLTAAAVAILVMGAFATLRRSALILPAAVLVVFIVYRPRAMLRALPLFLPILLVAPFVVPDALGSTVNQLVDPNSNIAASNEGRTEDYLAVFPDVVARTATGRGWGTFQPDVYRFLDNQYLLTLVEVGVLGLAAFVLMLIAGWVEGHRGRRSRERRLRRLSLSAVGATAAFMVARSLRLVLLHPAGIHLPSHSGAVARWEGRREGAGDRRR